MIIGTCHFPSKNLALHYYKKQGGIVLMQDIDQKIADGEIHIGKPTLKPGEKLTLLDDSTRYGIIEAGDNLSLGALKE
jgi:hypothetical protein